MSEEQLEEKMQAQENKVLITLGIVLFVFWVMLIVIDITGEGLAGFIYFLYGLLNIGAFLVFFRTKAKKNQEKWIKTSLFEEKDDK